MIKKINLGLKNYNDVFNDMIKYTALRQQTPQENVLWLVEHSPVFTQGKHGKPEHILNLNNIPIVQTDRGGQVTYHGPGQAIIYFLLDIKELSIGAKKLVSLIEKACANVLAKNYGIKTHLIDGAHGIYVDNKKIASLGLRIKQGKTYHGIAINTKMDLTPFNYINPCGYQNLQMCQISDFDENVTVDNVLNQYADEFIKLCDEISLDK